MQVIVLETIVHRFIQYSNHSKFTNNDNDNIVINYLEKNIVLPNDINDLMYRRKITEKLLFKMLNNTPLEFKI